MFGRTDKNSNKSLMVYVIRELETYFFAGFVLEVLLASDIDLNPSEKFLYVSNKQRLIVDYDIYGVFQAIYTGVETIFFSIVGPLIRDFRQAHLY